MRIFILLIGLMLIVDSLSAQFACGTTNEYHPEINQQKLDIIKKQLSEKTIVNDSVAVTFHIVNNAVNIEVVLNEIILLNNYFAGAGITFFSCGSPRYIDGGSSFTFNEGDILNQRNHVSNTVNVYYVRQVQDNAGNDLCGYAYLPGLAAQDRYAIVSTAGGCLVSASTLAHELGHFYGLPHTHALNGGREFVDGSNCSSAGDRFCDTPADPNLGRAGIVDNSCIYVGGERDPKGNVYKPLVSNLMSYAPPRCSNKFSNEQLARVRFIHENENNFVLDQCNFFPDFEVTTKTNISKIRADQNLSIEYEFENKGVQEDFKVPVFVYLSDDPNQRGFIIKKDTISFSALEGKKLETFDINLPLNSSSNKYFLTILVDPTFKFLELQETNNLFTLEFSVDNQELGDELVFPNPTTGSFKLFIRDPKIANTFIMSIYDVDGRLKKRLEGFKNQDEYFKEIDISEFREGLYIMEVFFVKHDRRKTFKIYKTD